MKKWFMAGLCFVLLILNGCVEQGVKIKLNADGSGRIEVVRNLSEMESGMELLGTEEADGFETMTVNRSVEEVDAAPFRKVERTVYTFTNLAESLPELENAVSMMPRFTIRDDRLVVFIRHEMNEYHGFSRNNYTNSFYRLEIEFPVPPSSEDGRVEGNRFSWNANHDELTKFSKSDIGTLAFECSVPASAVQFDLSPRLVEYEEAPGTLNGGKKKIKMIDSLNVTIPILGKSSAREGENASLRIFLPVAQDQLPLCYENLRAEQLVVDGAEVAAVLKSNPSGVFFGTDRWGRPASGLPVELQFGWDSNTLGTIDRIQVSMNAAKPSRTAEYQVRVVAAKTAESRLEFTGPHDGMQLGVLEIRHVHNQTAMLKVLTNLSPDDLSMVYLDTDYGLRYSAKGMSWKGGERQRTREKDLANKLFGEEGSYSVVEILYPHVPTTEFGLEFELVEEKEMAELVLEKENIDVY